jgi:hypothetical protein
MNTTKPSNMRIPRSRASTRRSPGKAPFTLGRNAAGAAGTPTRTRPSAPRRGRPEPPRAGLSAFRERVKTTLPGRPTQRQSTRGLTGAVRNALTRGGSGAVQSRRDRRPSRAAMAGVAGGAAGVGLGAAAIARRRRGPGEANETAAPPMALISAEDPVGPPAAA